MAPELKECASGVDGEPDPEPSSSMEENQCPVPVADRREEAQELEIPVRRRAGGVWTRP